jgi:hypothetical protein
MRSPQKKPNLPRRSVIQIARIPTSEPENLVTAAQSENLVDIHESENLGRPTSPATASPADPCSTSYLATLSSAPAAPRHRSMVREHSPHSDVQIHEAARIQVVKATAEHVNAPQRKRQNIGATPSDATHGNASRAQLRGKVRARGVERADADIAMAAANAVHSATQPASEPPRKKAARPAPSDDGGK